MRVIHMGTMIRRTELVRICLPRLDWRLRYKWNAILRVGKLDAVEVDRCGFRQLILDVDAHAISLAHADVRPRNHPIVAPRFAAFARLRFPLNPLCDKVEYLDPA